MSIQRELNRTRMAEAAHQNAVAALTNEQQTRQRVERLEARTGKLENHSMSLAARALVLERDFWGRLRWLLTGR